MLCYAMLYYIILYYREILAVKFTKRGSGYGVM